MKTKLYYEIASKFDNIRNHRKVSEDFNKIFKEHKTDFEFLKELAYVLYDNANRFYLDNRRLYQSYNKTFEKLNEYIIVNNSLGTLDYYFNRIGLED